MQVPNKSVVTYTGTWQARFFKTPREVLAEVASRLTSSGLIVRESTEDAGFFETISLGATFNVRMTIQIENGIGFGSENDVASVVNHAVYQVVEIMPSAWSVPFIQIPGGSQQATGQPLPTPPPPKSNPLSDWITSLTQKGMWAISLILIGIIGALFLISYSGYEVKKG